MSNQTRAHIKLQLNTKHTTNTHTLPSFCAHPPHTGLYAVRCVENHISARRKIIFYMYTQQNKNTAQKYE